jgi:hypothetical protein
VVAGITAPVLTEHPLLPAKLILLGTNFSTLSSLDYYSSRQYAGTFFLRNIPAGTYRVAIERPGAETLFVSSLTVPKGEEARVSWHLQPTSPPENLVQNSTFALRWLSASAPDHWHRDSQCRCWLSDNIPVSHGNVYRAYIVPSGNSNRAVSLQWMAMHWLRTDDPPVPLPSAHDLSHAVTLTAPPAAVYVRIAVYGDDPPQDSLRTVTLVPGLSSVPPSK